MTSPLAELVRTKKVLVLCGAGGVGKTTTSAAVALMGARQGRRVLVLTIDPARRLAEALGLPPHGAKPSPVPADRLEKAGLTGGGRLDAWMLDPRAVFEQVVRRHSPSPEAAEALIKSRLYGHMTELIAGMQEYTAGEALYGLVTEGDYDLVVLDTPPSRNALDFLDAPARLGRFLDEGVIQLFLPSEGGGLLRRATGLVGRVFGRVFGGEFVEEMQTFLTAMAGMFGAMRTRAEGVRQLLASEQSAFLLVTSTEAEAVGEALAFREQIQQRGLPMAGFVLNRSLARSAELVAPADYPLPANAPPELTTAFAKLGELARREAQAAEAHKALLAKLAKLAGPSGFALAAPQLAGAVEDLAGLVALSAALG